MKEVVFGKRVFSAIRQRAEFVEQFDYEELKTAIVKGKLKDETLVAVKRIKEAVFGKRVFSAIRQRAGFVEQFDYEELKTATNNFNVSERFGISASSTMFKGKLKDGTLVAVKRIDDRHFAKERFEAEVSAIGNVKHAHIIRIRGYCDLLKETKGRFFIVYDFASNGSLNKLLLSPKIGNSLPWKVRYSVAIDIARALHYLHHDCRPPVIHFDVKPGNILLDRNFRAALTGFGFSELANEDGSISDDTIRGTKSYIAPEWISGAGVSNKCDIYSYGRLLMDLFFGQQYLCLDQDGYNIYNKWEGNSVEELRVFHTLMWKRLKANNLMTLMDKRLQEEDGVDEKEVSFLVCAALLCLEDDPEKRIGDMNLVVKMLEGRTVDGIEEYRQMEIAHDGFDQKVIAILRGVESIEFGDDVGGFFRKFHYGELLAATRKFSNKLGGGGCGQVFKGFVEVGTPIAIKKVLRDLGGHREFLTELSTIAYGQHPNIVPLRGYCSHVIGSQRELFIVYDFFNNGSLDTWIFPQRPHDRYLTWKQRCRVAVDVAEALLYLHRDCPKQIIHLDIKPENILVGDDFRGVVADFGMSKLMDKGDTSMHTQARGTTGYMAPEWYSSYRKSKNVDIFSYGKVLLDMFLGRWSVCFDMDGKNVYLNGGNMPVEQRRSLKYLKKKIEQKSVLDHLDVRLKNENVDEMVAGCFLGVAIKCLKEHPDDRLQDMSEVLKMLEPVLNSLGDVDAGK